MESFFRLDTLFSFFSPSRNYSFRHTHMQQREGKSFFSHCSELYSIATASHSFIIPLSRHF